MKQVLMTIAAVLATMTATAQTMNVQQGVTTYQFPATQTGNMLFNGSQSLTIMGKTFSPAEIGKMWTDETAVTDNEVKVAYNGQEALVTVAGNVAKYVTVTVDGAHVTIAQSEELTTDMINAGEAPEIAYTLSGTSTDGSFNMTGDAKATINLNGLTLTNPSGAPVNIENGKRIAVSVKKDSENTLTDGATGSQKGCLYVKGHLELKGKGTLNIYANGSKAHGIKCGDYMEMKNCTVNILKATKNGVSCNEYFLMESGTLNISNVGDDGIQCDIDNDEGTSIAASDAADGGHEDEDTGNIYLQGGNLNINVSALAAKGIKAAGDITVTDGTYTVTTTGNGTWDTEDLETKAASCVSADGSIYVSGGTLNLTSTGSGGKGMKCDVNMVISGGTINVTTSGGLYYNNGITENLNYTGDTDRIDSKYYSSPKGIKAGVSGSISSKMTITGGVINVSTAGHNGEGIECKGTIDITGGQTIVNSYDDGINASSHLTIDGNAYVYSRATNNDGLDANGNVYIKGGLVYAVGSGGAEKSIDANTEQNYKLYITGGTIIAVGSLESGVSITGGTCMQTTNWSGDTWYALYNGSTLVAAFQTPTKSNSGGGFYAPGFGGNSSNPLVVYTSSEPTLKSGVTVSNGTEYLGGMLNIGGSVSGGNDVTLSAYSSNSGGGPGHGW